MGSGHLRHCLMGDHSTRTYTNTHTRLIHSSRQIRLFAIHNHAQGSSKTLFITAPTPVSLKWPPRSNIVCLPACGGVNGGVRVRLPPRGVCINTTRNFRRRQLISSRDVSAPFVRLTRVRFSKVALSACWYLCAEHKHINTSSSKACGLHFILIYRGHRSI